MAISTADLCDDHIDELQVVEPLLKSYGGVRAIAGIVATVQVYEDNTLVRDALTEPGNGRVLVVDGGGSQHCALVGDNLVQLGSENGWAGIVVFGCIRDSAQIAQLPLGVWALATNPRRSVKRGQGQRDVEVRFLGTTFKPGHYLYADDDGIVVAARDVRTTA